MFDNRLNFLVASVVIFMIHLQSLFKRLIDFKTIGIANRNCVLHIYLTWVCPTPKVCFYFLITLQEKSEDSVWFETSITKKPSYNNFYILYFFFYSSLLPTTGPYPRTTCWRVSVLLPFLASLSSPKCEYTDY